MSNPKPKKNFGNKGGGRKTKREEIMGLAFYDYFLQLAEKEKAPVFNALFKEAKKGNVHAIREILERKLGKVAIPINIKETKKLIKL